ncbi:MAG TPA: succinate dehydrogenase assembly factor 2 [Steroidobacteraceae bacterium]|nr:succinate dehydrogenase assembly factor 2 [Steroidobacteraceae bacterium]
MDPSEGQLKWHCRRGMKELDEVLARFVNGPYRQAPQHTREAFVRLLELPDPLLAAVLLGREPPPAADLAGIIGLVSGSRDGPAGC